MGKAVPKLVKQRSHTLLEEYPDRLSKDFEKNKEFLHSLNLPFSKVEINLMSGYIARKNRGKKE